MHSMIIIILGGGLGHGRTRIGLASKLRARAGAKLYRRQLFSQIIVSGGVTAHGAKNSEAVEMRRYLMEHENIPSLDIVTEADSLSTPENVRNVVTILRTMPMASASEIVLIAGRRNRAIAADYFRAAGFPVQTRTVRQILGSRDVPASFEDRLTEQDRKNIRHARFFRMVDPKGKFLAWWLRRRRE